MAATALAEMRSAFATSKRAHGGSLMQFRGIDGYDVFNCSAPFHYKGKLHMYGRVERRQEAGQAVVRLFAKSSSAADDVFSLVSDNDTYVTLQLEDPCVARVHGEMVLGGTMVVRNCDAVSFFYHDFYRGALEHMVYYSCGPDHMKHICVTELQDKNIGIFTRIKDAICFTTVKSLDELNQEHILAAAPVGSNSASFKGALGVVKQALLLSTGKVGCIAQHACGTAGGYITSFVYDVKNNAVQDFKIVASRECFPECPSKSGSEDVYASGIMVNEDGRCVLYAGLGDTHEGHISIEYPFEGHGSVVDNIACKI